MVPTQGVIPEEGRYKKKSRHNVAQPKILTRNNIITGMAEKGLFAKIILFLNGSNKIVKFKYKLGFPLGFKGTFAF